MTENHHPSPTPTAGSPSTTSTPGRAVVHLVRHGLVHNPDGVLYGRLPDFHLSGLGREMAQRAADHLADADVTHLVSSPLERARETMEPVAAHHPGLEVGLDERVLEAGNLLQGRVLSSTRSELRDPRLWWHLRTPLRPSWGEPYRDIVARMRAAVQDAARAADGHEAVIVSHQLPIWMARCDAEGRRLAHDPRRRQCSLASITSLTLIEGRVVSVAYTEPAKDLLPPKSAKMVAGA